ncbi:MAG: hypothetical protein U0169_25465 [Polyangiaceae bacterium]
MNQRRLWGTTLFAVSALLAGCSFLIRVESDQCVTDDDCRTLGAEFANSVCSAGVCARRGAVADSGSDTSTVDGATGDAADGGTEATATGCTTSAACTAQLGTEGYCRTPGTPCVRLKSDDCPLVFGQFDRPNAIILGGFSPLPETDLKAAVPTNVFELAMIEFATVSGLPAGSGGARRPLAMVVCRQDTSEHVISGARHLVDDLQSQAIVSSLSSSDLKDMFEQVAKPKGVFVMNALNYDSSYASLVTNNLLWHAIGNVADVSPAYVALLSRLERFAFPTPDGGTRPDIRVAVIYTDELNSVALQDKLAGSLTFNGKSAAANATANPQTYRAFRALPEVGNEVNSALVSQLLEYRPHVVISTGGVEFNTVIDQLDTNWSLTTGLDGGAVPPWPRYIASPYNLQSRTQTFVNGTSVGQNLRRADRTLGINVASAADKQNYNKYIVRLNGLMKRTPSVSGYENWYDATYLTAYAMQAGSPAGFPTGAEIARGMPNLVEQTERPISTSGPSSCRMPICSRRHRPRQVPLHRDPRPLRLRHEHQRTSRARLGLLLPQHAVRDLRRDHGRHADGRGRRLPRRRFAPPQHPGLHPRSLTASRAIT